MADRAYRKGEPNKDVFDLENDERWQERLAEARARREIALSKKGETGPPKPKPKPWETEATTEKQPEIVVQSTPKNEKGFDFADRVNSIRESKDVKTNHNRPKNTHNRVPVENKEAIDEKKLFDEMRSLSSPYSVSPEDFVGTEGVESKRETDADEIADRYGATLVPDDEEYRPSYLRDRQAEPLAVEVSSEPEIVAPVSPVKYRRGRPSGLIFLILAMASFPLFVTLPPLELGPVPFAIKPVANQPALGITGPLILEPEIVSPVILPVGLQTIPAGPAKVVGDVVPVFGRLNIDLEAPKLELLDPPRIENVENVERMDVPSGPSLVVSETLLVTRDIAPRVSPFPRARPFSEKAEPVARTALPLRVTILVTKGSNLKAAQEIGYGLVGRGHELAEIKPVSIEIGSRNLRYFHGEDREAASLVAEAYGAVLRDFTSFRPSPKKGVVELWLDK